MAIADLFLNNPRTRAARYAASQAEAGALRQTAGVLGNRAVNPAAAAMAQAQTSAAQRAASHGQVAAAQAADEQARVEGGLQLAQTGLSALSSVLPFMTMGGGQAAQAGLGAAQQALGAAAPSPAPQSAAQGAMGPPPFQGFGGAAAPFMGAPQTALGMQRSAAPAAPAPEPGKPSGPDVPQQGVTLFQPGQMPLVPKPPWQGYPQPAAGPQPMPEGAPLAETGPADPRSLQQQMPMTEAYRVIDGLAPPEPSRPAPAAPRVAQPAPAPSPSPGTADALRAQDQSVVNIWRALDPWGFSLFARGGMGR